MEPHSPFKSRNGLARIAAAARYSVDGLRQAWASEAAFRQELALCAVLAPVALLAPVTAIERLLLIGSLGVVLIVELLNSAIEAVVDRVSLDPHPLAGRAKDLGSAAVMLAILLAAATWLTVLLPLLAAA